MKWIKDEDFLRDKVPMTKFNIRVLSMAYLSIKEGDRFLDIGAGTGSIGLQAAHLGAKVWAIESNPTAVELIKENCEHLNVSMHLIDGKAPEDLPEGSFNKIFVGGSKGQLKGIFDYIDKNLEQKGIVVGNFITIKNAHEFLALLEEREYDHIEFQLIQTSAMDRLGLLRGENPIFIIKGVKK